MLRCDFHSLDHVELYSYRFRQGDAIPPSEDDCIASAGTSIYCVHSGSILFCCAAAVTQVDAHSDATLGSAEAMPWHLRRTFLVEELWSGDTYAPTQ
jgi:hypothetical protein